MEKHELELMREDIEHMIRKYNICAKEMGVDTIGLASCDEKNCTQSAKNNDRRSELVERYNSMLGDSSMDSHQMTSTLNSLNFNDNGDSISWRTIASNKVFTDNHGVIAKISLHGSGYKVKFY